MNRVQLVVWHKNSHRPAYYVVDTSWRIDGEMRMIVIGQGLPRKMIPFDNILSFDIEEIER